MPTRRVGRIAGLTAASILALAGCTAASGAPVGSRTASVSPTSSTGAPGSASDAPTSPAPSSTTTPPGPVRIVGLGDSVTAGTNCGCTDFVTQYASGYSKAHGVRTTSDNLGSNGATAASLVEDLADDATTRRDVGGSDIVLVTIGANDLVPLIGTWQRSGCSASCYDPAVAQMGTQVRTVVQRIEQLRAGRPTTILVTDYWNVFEDGQVADDDYGAAFSGWSDAVTRQANSAIRDAVADVGGAVCVDLYEPFKADGSSDDTDYLASDGDHPNAAGTALIARTLLAATPSRPTSG